MLGISFFCFLCCWAVLILRLVRLADCNRLVLLCFLFAKIVYRRAAGLGCVTGEFCWMGHASARLALRCHCCLCFLLLFIDSCWGKKQSIHAPTSTPWRFLHGAMLGVWRKMPLPHRNRRRKTLQTQKANAPNCRHVAGLKRPHQHKEKKAMSYQRMARLGWSACGVSVYYLAILSRTQKTKGKNLL